MTYETLLFSIEDNIARITLNRPGRINAITAIMHEELRDVFTRLEKPASARCVIMTGAGRGFCSGQDLTERKASGTDERRDLSQSLQQNYNPLIKRMAALPIPIISAVNGVAAGAGASLALAADIVLAGHTTKWVQAFVNIGLIPDAGGTYVLPRRVGLARALGMTLIGAPVTGKQAADWGLIWASVEDGKLIEEAEALAQTIAAKAPLALASIKKIMRTSLDNGLAEQLDLEAEFQRRCGYTDDYQEGIASFLEKRTPTFQGK
jgi:2-(1,2-epoxy-1,2-dihydrophenyl)acetyl-CoA isomerase